MSFFFFCFCLLGGLLGGERADDVRVTSIGDGERADAEVLAAGRAQRVVVALVVLHQRLGQQRVVLDLRLTQRGSVAGQDDQLGLARAQSLERRLVAEGVLKERM